MGQSTGSSVKLIIHADVKQPFNPSDCKWTDDCCALHEPTGCVFDMDPDGDVYLVRTEGSLPTLRDVVLAARAAQIFMEEVPIGVVPDKPSENVKPSRKTRPVVFDWVM
jgi:hypothetical protein